MVPVAVSVPGDAKVTVKMHADNWAFGEIVGTPRNE